MAFGHRGEPEGPLELWSCVRRAHERPESLGTLGLEVCLVELEDWRPPVAPMTGKEAPGSTFGFEYVLISREQAGLSGDFVL